MAFVPILLSLSCGGSASSNDTAVAFHDAVSDLELNQDADQCFYSSGFPPDIAFCETLTGGSVVLDLGVDAGGCENRPTIPCNGACENVIFDLVASCGRWPNDSPLVVTFSDGCADHIYLAPSMANRPEAACLELALRSFHYSCADHVRCWEYFMSTLI